MQEPTHSRPVHGRKALAGSLLVEPMSTLPSRRIVALAAALFAATVGLVPSSGAADSRPLVVTAPVTAHAGAAVEVTATFGNGADCRLAHPDRFDFIWGDGRGNRATVSAESPCSATLTHTFTEEGNYRVVVRAFRNNVLVRAGQAQVTVANTVPVIQPIPDALLPLRRSPLHAGLPRRGGDL